MTHSRKSCRNEVRLRHLINYIITKPKLTLTTISRLKQHALRIINFSFCIDKIVLLKIKTIYHEKSIILISICNNI